MSIIIPDEIVQAARMTEEEIKQEIALFLFEKERLTLSQASRFCGMNQVQFQHCLASRQIPVHYDAADFEQDMQTLQRLGRL